MRPKILLIYTGGTIGMQRDPESGSLTPFNFDLLLDKVGELRQLDCEIQHLSLTTPKDSSEIEADDWLEIRDIIFSNKEAFFGFVVLHGSDTMSYTASALSFLLLGLNKPVVFTGSQLPVGDLRTDAKENLITAIQIASLAEEGEPLLKEVGLYFEYKLYRANRSIKISAEHFEAFASPNYPPLITAGIHLDFNQNQLLTETKALDGVSKISKLASSVLLLKLYPNMPEELFHWAVDLKSIKTIVLETFGAGNAMKSRSLEQLLQHSQQNGISVINCTQCAGGSVAMGMYAASNAFKKFGVLDGSDLTTEAALAKAMVLNELNLPIETFRKLMVSSLCGEISVK